MTETRSGSERSAAFVASASDRPSAGWRAARDGAASGPHLGDAWIAYRVAQGRRPAYLSLASPAIAIVAVGVAFLQRPRLRPWVRARATLDLLPCLTGAARARPGVDLAAAHTEVARAVLALARESGWAGVEIESFDGPSPPPDLAALGCATRERHEFMLDLSVPADARFAAIKSSHRRKVRDAEKSGVTVADETGAPAIELLRELQGHTQERRSDRGEEMSLPDPAQYQRLAAAFVGGGGARLFVGRKEGRALSTILCGVQGARAYYFMGGTSPEGFECNAATLVLWRASVLLAELGVRSFNLGGVPRDAELEGHPQQGLLRFKEGFGAARIECRSGTWTRSGAP